MKYIVTGGTGFIGSHLTKKLLDRGDHVTVIDNFESSSLESLEDYLGFDATLAFRSVGHSTDALTMLGIFF